MSPGLRATVCKRVVREGGRVGGWHTSCWLVWWVHARMIDVEDGGGHSSRKQSQGTWANTHTPFGTIMCSISGLDTCPHEPTT